MFVVVLWMSAEVESGCVIGDEREVIECIGWCSSRFFRRFAILSQGCPCRLIRENCLGQCQIIAGSVIFDVRRRNDDSRFVEMVYEELNVG